jgi:hypothetical protein
LAVPVPENRIYEVKNLLAGAHVESVTESNLLDDFIVLKQRWGERLKAHQGPDGKVAQPRWSKCWEMWQELAQVIQQSHQG